MTCLTIASGNHWDHNIPFSAFKCPSYYHTNDNAGFTEICSYDRSQCVACRWYWLDYLCTHRGSKRTLSGAALHPGQVCDMPYRRKPSGSRIAGKAQKWRFLIAECDAKAMPRCREGFDMVVVSHAQCLNVLAHAIPMTGSPVPR